MELIAGIAVIADRAGVEDGFTVDQAVALINVWDIIDPEMETDFTIGEMKGDAATLFSMAKQETAVGLLSKSERTTLARAANQVMNAIGLEHLGSLGS